MLSENGDCELQKIAADLGVRKMRFEGGETKTHTIDNSNPTFGTRSGKMYFMRALYPCLP